MKKLGLLALLSAAAVTIAGCGAKAQTAEYFGKTEPPSGQEMRYITGSEPESLDPQVSTGQPEARIYLALYEGLTEYHPVTGEAMPAIAERWEPNADNSEFTFHLRHNARFSNGDPITAGDFVYTLRRGLAPALAARAAYLAYYIKGAQAYNEGRGRAEDVGIQAVDNFTLKITLTQPLPFLDGLMAHQFFRVLPQKTIEKYGDAWTEPAHIVTSGAFKVETWRHYDRLILVRDPMNWDAARVKLDRITFYPLEDVTTMMNLYKAGEVDAVYNHTVPYAWVDQIRHLPDYMDKPEVAIEYYGINTTKPPMNDLRVRKAFNLAVDKSALAEYRRVVKPLTSFTPEGIFPKYPRPTGDGFDPQRGRDLLAEAGFRGADGKFDPSKFPASSLEILYNTTESNKQTAEFVQAQWKQNLGITIPLKNMEWKTFLDERAKLRFSGFSRQGWIADYMDPYSFLDLFSTPTGENGTGWFDPKYKAMLEEANRQPDPQKRYELLAKAESYMLEAQPIVPLWTSGSDWLKKPYVKGMYSNPIILHPWKYVYIEHDRSKWNSDPLPAITSN
ncbi:MAG TPA: peptide ABC transporter substrate-binding protein [Vicinamibacterales bacterium]|nr:peptide ABC transporter substrate-binding protein [Vicinamibacterales bacterium]